MDQLGGLKSQKNADASVFLSFSSPHPLFPSELLFVVAKIFGFGCD